MFPIEDLNLGSPVENNVVLCYRKKDIAFDVNKCEFVTTGGALGVVKDKEHLIQWIHLALKTFKKFYAKNSIVNSEYGVDFESVLFSTNPLEVKYIKIKKEITNALMINKEIVSVGGFSFSTKGKTIIVDFTVNTVYGNVSESVVL